MKLTIVLTLVAGLLFTQDVDAQRGKNGWKVLGSKQVDWKPERDVLRVGSDEGGFTKLKIKVTGGTVFIARMVVTYGNGTKDEIPLKYRFGKGAESRVIDLRGGTRVIKKITFVYDRKNPARGAKVWVAGRR